ncbi:diguanylate cyclase (GGDEF)-like protein [Erythrobacter lutimaris]|nr:diguanylate cyclase (GGDEF)-like protein [Alteriqipengyuania lutimaris]
MNPESNLRHVEQAADKGLHFAQWPAALRQMWRDEQVPRRRRELAFINAIALISCIFCVPLDYSNGPEMFGEGLVLRLGLVVPAYLLAIYAALRGGWAFQRWTSILSAVCFAGVAGYLGMHNGAVPQDEYVMGAALIVVLAVVVVPLRPGSIAVLVFLSLAVLWTVWAVLPPPRAREAFALLAYLSAISLVALAVPFRTATLKDRNFLYAVRGRLAADRLMEANEQLRELSHRDDLTGLPNRRYFERIFHTAFRAASEQGDDLAVMMIDVDHFKQFNDTHDHVAGDRALKQVATELEKQFAEVGGTVARFGGEEFVAVVEHCSEEEALILADRARRAVAQRPVTLDIGGRVTLSVSIGVALRQNVALSPDALSPASLSADALIDRADEALYAAKTAGRNIVRLAARADVSGSPMGSARAPEPSQSSFVTHPCGSGAVPIWMATSRSRIFWVSCPVPPLPMVKVPSGPLTLPTGVTTAAVPQAKVSIKSPFAASACHWSIE